MVTPQSTLWEVIREALSTWDWTQLQEIYDAVDEALRFDSEDLLPEVEGSSQEAWKRNVRNVLQRRKRTEEVVWKRGGFYKLPGEDAREVALISRLPLSRGLTADEFKALQEKRRRTGEEGELFVLNHERSYLRQNGRPDLAARVRHVSLEDVGAGYDIASFELDGSDKYIEVKSNSGASRYFELTVNELRTAERRGSTYWLYIVRDVARNPRVTTIHNPASKVGEAFELEPSSFRGALLK